MSSDIGSFSFFRVFRLCSTAQDTRTQKIRMSFTVQWTVKGLSHETQKRKGDCHSDLSQGNLSFSLGFSFEFNSERACFQAFFVSCSFS